MTDKIEVQAQVQFIYNDQLLPVTQKHIRNLMLLVCPSERIRLSKATEAECAEAFGYLLMESLKFNVTQEQRYAIFSGTPLDELREKIATGEVGIEHWQWDVCSMCYEAGERDEVSMVAPYTFPEGARSVLMDAVEAIAIESPADLKTEDAKRLAVALQEVGDLAMAAIGYALAGAGHDPVVVRPLDLSNAVCGLLTDTQERKPTAPAMPDGRDCWWIGFQLAYMIHRARAIKLTSLMLTGDPRGTTDLLCKISGLAEFLISTTAKIAVEEREGGKKKKKAAAATSKKGISLPGGKVAKA